MKKEIYLNVRISQELFDSIKKETLLISLKENKIRNISQVVRNVLEKNFLK